MHRDGMATVLVGIAGETRAGKSRLAEALVRALHPLDVALLRQDDYLLTLPEAVRHDPLRRNFDHPDAFDCDVLAAHLASLRAGRPVAAPVFDGRSHSRTGVTRAVAPAPVVVVEGLHVLAVAAIRERLDMKVFVDTAADLRFVRRLERDSASGRGAGEVIDQYLEPVRPMHEELVEPSRGWADVVISGAAAQPPRRMSCATASRRCYTCAANGRRVITVASGKGGVGKSTFAVNFALALSRVAPDGPGRPRHRDLVGPQHHRRPGRARPLPLLPARRAARPLPDDPAAHARPDGRCSATSPSSPPPQHAMEEITNFSDEHRDRADARHQRAPGDVRGPRPARRPRLPTCSTSCPTPTPGSWSSRPHHPAATMAAAEIVKALLFRKLRLVFAPRGPLVGRAGRRPARHHQRAARPGRGRLRRPDPQPRRLPRRPLPRLRRRRRGPGPGRQRGLVRRLLRAQHVRRGPRVLRRGRGAVRALPAAATSRPTLSIHNLGWIVTSPEVHRSNCERRPIVLQRPGRGGRPAGRRSRRARRDRQRPVSACRHAAPGRSRTTCCPSTPRRRSSTSSRSSTRCTRTRERDAGARQLRLHRAPRHAPAAPRCRRTSSASAGC